MKCKANTTKKAWDNPLAPMATCSREAVSGNFCATHSPEGRARREAQRVERWTAEAVVRETQWAKEKAQRRLHDAAADLLDATETLLFELLDSTPVDRRSALRTQVIAAARAAIAKARGLR